MDSREETKKRKCGSCDLFCFFILYFFLLVVAHGSGFFLGFMEATHGREQHSLIPSSGLSGPESTQIQYMRHSCHSRGG